MESTAGRWELENFCKEAQPQALVDDFIAKIEPRRSLGKLHIEAHGLEWNEQGEIFIMLDKTIHGNSQFQKLSALRWAWEFPGGQYIFVLGKNFEFRKIE
ncbi:unnamed protein product [Heligmosomoides polygyrus]|uniref:DUF4440 domain-containing protein n=1 Tax=Heligmosomoides polygyrus TaxID=6339 RepID=A0A183GH55_HELPZ|nr:unnamed protein product [Heligmosomoides polygyrus]